jgi:hypothetical protein
VKKDQLKFEIPLGNCSLKSALWPLLAAQVPWNRTLMRVIVPSMAVQLVVNMGQLKESGCLGMQPKAGGIFHLRLNIGKRPIANKYCEGKMKSTLKRESNST